MNRIVVAGLATGVIVGLAACDPIEPPPVPAPETKITPTEATALPEEVRAAVLTLRPGMIIAEAELKEREGRRYYDVEGTLDGAEIELDLLETPRGWTVVEIQRDVDWTAVPVEVRSAAARSRTGFMPIRVIESVQTGGGAVIYELFAHGQPETPAVEVRFADGRAEVLKQAWPH